MGYTTDFEGSFELNKPLDENLYKFLVLLNYTRRMKRNVDPIFGIEGEFYVFGTRFAGQDHEDNIIDHNYPPKTQPSLWCQWVPTNDRQHIVWDNGEKFYNYIDWIVYIYEYILYPCGYTLSGEVKWSGEDQNDVGIIRADSNYLVVDEMVRKLNTCYCIDKQYPELEVLTHPVLENMDTLSLCPIITYH